MNLMFIVLGVLSGPPQNVIVPLLGLIDLPLSLALDTVFLVYTLPKFIATGLGERNFSMPGSP